MSLLLTQHEADALLTLEKHYMDSARYTFPSLGGSLRIPLFSVDKREEFSLDVTRGRIELRKNTFQARARKAVILARIDIGGPPHRNPDGEEMGCPHLHLYREGFGDKWAIALPDVFSETDNAWVTLNEFMDYCNVATKPTILQEIFI